MRLFKVSINFVLWLLVICFAYLLFTPTEKSAGEIYHQFRTLGRTHKELSVTSSARDKQGFTSEVKDIIIGASDDVLFFPCSASVDGSSIGINASLGNPPWYRSVGAVHNGVDIFPFHSNDTTGDGLVIAPVSGTIGVAETSTSVQVTLTNDSHRFEFWHCGSLYNGISEGDTVQAGQPIAYVGNQVKNGYRQYCTAAHLHYEVHQLDAVLSGGSLVSPFDMQVVKIPADVRDYDNLPDYKETPTVKFKFDSNVDAVYLPPVYGQEARKDDKGLIIDDFKYAGLVEANVVDNNGHRPHTFVATHTFQDTFTNDKGRTSWEG